VKTILEELSATGEPKEDKKKETNLLTKNSAKKKLLVI
jgi:hypothetical protein